MISRGSLANAVLLIAVGLSAGCASPVESPSVDEILVDHTTVEPGETVPLTLAASGSDLRFEWSVNRGSLSDPTRPAVVYTAPTSAGPDIVTVRIIYEGGEVIRSVTFDVVAPLAPTATAAPTLADTPTAVPAPIACNNPAVTRNLFPQLSNLDGQNPIYGPENESKYSCEAVYDNVHNQPLAVHLKYESVGANFGWWGISTPKGYDATSYKEICFWGYARQPNQAFRLKMKDTSRKEDGIIVILEEANQWTEICSDLTKFAELFIRLDRLENVNLGFEQPTGSAEVWVADFEFK